jgi:hypothetical protein
MKKIYSLTETTIESEKYFCSIRHIEAVRFFIQIKVETRNKFLCFKWKTVKTYKVHNIMLLTFMGIEKEYLNDQIIYFFNYDDAKKFLEFEYKKINKQGIYIGDLTPEKLSKKYNCIMSQMF